ncbi:hypothetical protein PM082_003629 [Marasmius tenuissimus]|nr:hypothetical protein PM082_003629 [Marasmius tenuissimus]
MYATLRTKNITFNDRDNALQYQGFWLQEAWSASSVGQTGTLSSSNDPFANITFNLPEPAIAIYVFGLPRSQSGLYGLCIDCDPNNPRFQTIDSLNTSNIDAPNNPPVMLFSKRFDTPAQHVIVMRSENDTRIVPAGKFQMVIDRFVLEVVDDPQVPVTPSSPSSTPSPSPSFNSESVKFGPPIGAIVGGAVGGFLLAIIVIVTGVYYWNRRRRKLASAHVDLDTDDSEASFPTIIPYPVMHSYVSKEERPKAGESSPTPQRPPSPTPSSGSTAIVTYFRFRRRDQQRGNDVGRRPSEWRRESDAGPVPLEDEEFTLPPLYEQVFQAGSLNCPPSDEVPHPGPMAAAVVQETEK